MNSLHLTPSERAHEELLSIPSRLPQKDAQKLRPTVLLKNLIGWPISFLLVLTPIVSVCYPPACDVLLFLVSALVLAYILCDIFSLQREWHFYRLGIEIFAILLTGFLIAKSLILKSPVNTLELFQQYGWVIWIYALTYGIDLFPGIDRLTFWFLTILAVVTLLTLVVAVTGQFPLPQLVENLQPIYFPFFTVYRATPPLLTYEDWSALSSLVFAFCLLLFISPPRGGSDYRWLFGSLAVLEFTALFLLFDRNVWLCTSVALGIALLYSNKKSFMLFVLSGLLIFAAWEFVPQVKEFFSPAFATTDVKPANSIEISA